MINLGMLFVAIGGLGCLLWWWKRKLWEQRWMLWILVSTIGLAQLATLTGWWTAEIGRQPWIVWQLLRTSDAYSPNVSAAQVATTIGMFVVLYAIVGGVFLFLLDKIIKAGPPEPPSVDDIESLPDTWSEAFQHRSRVSGGGR